MCILPLNSVTRIAVALLMTVTTSCKQFSPNNDVNSEHKSQSYQLTKQDSLMINVQHFNPNLQLNLTESIKLKEFSNMVFLYVSDAHCYSCIETILKETQHFLIKNKLATISVIYSKGLHNNFYSLKKAFSTNGFQFFLFEREDAFQEDFKLAFFFELDNQSQVKSVFIPEDSDITIPEYLIQTMN